MRSGDLIVATTQGSGTHLAHLLNIQIEGADHEVVASLCGLHKGLKIVENVKIDCRRCRNAGADRLRDHLLKLSDLNAQLDLEEERVVFLRHVLGDLV